MAIFLVICGLQILVGNWVGAKGYAGGAAGRGLRRVHPRTARAACYNRRRRSRSRTSSRGKGSPPSAYIVTLGCIVTIPGFPGSEMLTAYVSKISFIGLCTPILAYAGLAVGKGHRRAQDAGLEDSRRRPLRLRRNLHRLRRHRGSRAAHDELTRPAPVTDVMQKLRPPREGRPFCVLEVVVRPHTDDFDGVNLFQNFVDQPVLNVDSP